MTRYYVFHGVTRTKVETRWDAGYVNSTVTGFGRDQQAALADARRSEKKRYGDLFRSFGEVAHVSGPHEARRR